MTGAWDVVVVGAGSAGAALAARLSEDPSRRVLLIEAGTAPPSTDAYPAEARDGASVRASVPGHPLNWSYLGHLTPDLPYTVARGRILGGSSAINGAYFIRPRPEDLDGWSRTAGEEWSYQSTLPVMRAIESDLDHGATEVHGDSGPMPVQRARQDHPLTAAFDAAAREHGFPAEPDKNAPGPPGVGPVPQNVVDGMRRNTGMQYVLPARDRPNLSVRAGTRVRRVVFDGIRAVGVEAETAGRAERIEAGEVVLCAGAIATPHLLLVSGVGPGDPLREHGIGVVAEVSGVGREFTDHPDIALGWRAIGKLPPSPAAFTSALNFASGNEYPAGDLEILLPVRPLSALLTGSAAGAAKTAGRTLSRPVQFLKSLRGVSLRRLGAQAAHAPDRQLIVGLQAESARGSITLVSPDPAEYPRIDYNYLSTADDRARMRTGLRTAADVLRSHAFAGIFGGLTELDDATLADDDALDRWSAAHLGTAIHLCGSARMGSDTDPGAVCDPYGRVRGVTGLRVADTSLLPTAPSRGPAAAAILVGEQIARFIREEGDPA